MNYCVECLRYDYCSARRMCMDPPFGYCTRYQSKSGYGAKMNEIKGETNERKEDAETE